MKVSRCISNGVSAMVYQQWHCAVDQQPKLLCNSSALPKDLENRLHLAMVGVRHLSAKTILVDRPAREHLLKQNRNKRRVKIKRLIILMKL